MDMDPADALRVAVCAALGQATGGENGRWYAGGAR